MFIVYNNELNLTHEIIRPLCYDSAFVHSDGTSPFERLDFFRLYDHKNDQHERHLFRECKNHK